jgi:hypothetical protein
MRSLSARKRIALDNPVDVDGVRYSELRVRRAKPKDLAVIQPGADLIVGMSFAAHLCGVEVDVIASLNPSDAERVGAEVDRQISRIL